MLNHPPLRHLLLWSVVLFLVACAEENNVETENSDQPATTAQTEMNDDAAGLNYQAQLYSIPSPIQTAILLNESGVSYDESLLNKLDNRNKYVNRYQKAMNLGVYGADLAYLSGFNNSQIRLDYFETVRALMEDLEITGNIDASVVERVAKYIDNQDSLYVLNAELYRSADAYLKENAQNDVAGYILIGGWIESMFLSLEAAKNNEEIRSRIGEQKMALKSIIELLSTNEDAQVTALNDRLIALNEVFSELEVSYTFVQPITDSKSRTTYVNSKATVLISDEQLDEIAYKVNEIRTQIIQ